MSPAVPARSGRRTWLPRALAGLLAVVLVAAVAIAVVMYTKVRSHDQLEANRRDALTVAEQFALRMDSMGGDQTVQQYIHGIEKLQTTKAQAQFQQQIDLVKRVYQAAAKTDKSGDGTKGDIVYAGVSDADADSATVLVAHDSAVPGSDKALHFRWTVSMAKVNGRWLVDELPSQMVGQTAAPQ